MAAIQGDKAHKLRFFRDRVVLFPGFQNALERARFLINQAEFVDEPGGILVLAEGGCGKSLLGEQLRREFPRKESLYSLKVPIVFIDMGHRPDEKDFLIEILSQAGEVVSHNDFKVSELEKKVITALRRVGCRCIFIDEAQRLDTISTNRRKEDRKLGPNGELLKKIYTHARVTIILAGTPNLRELVDSDAQYSTRWSGRISLEPFTQGPEFQGVLNSLAQAIPLTGKTDFSGASLVAAIWSTCQGNFRRLKTFLGNALAIAIDEGASAVDAKHLHKAYLMSGDFNQPNPFAGLAK